MANGLPIFSCFVVLILRPALGFGSGDGAAGNDVAKKELRVVTLIEEPFMMHNEEDPEAAGNERFVGFLKDLLDEIADKANFSYTLYLTPDNKYGRYNEQTGQWTGMMGEVASGRADMAANALTITAARHLKFDLTKPFLFTGLTVLYKHPPLESADDSAFLRPLSSGAWLSVIAMYAFFSVSLWLVARCSPTERKRVDSDGQPVFSLSNSFWFATSSLVFRRTDASPKSIATRLLVLTWWLYSAILVVLYFALVAREHLTLRHLPVLTSWDDLLGQDEIALGTVKGGATQGFFETTEDPRLRRLAEAMKNNPAAMASSYPDGIERVEASDGRYAFFMETVAADYAIQQNCNFTKLEPEIHRRSYGMALSKGSEWTHTISHAILALQESGGVQALYDKWWHGTEAENCGGDSEDEDEDKQVYSLDASNISKHLGTLFFVFVSVIAAGGIFVGLVLCVFLAWAVAIFEVVWHALRSTDLSKPFLTRLTAELREIIGLDPTVGQIDRERMTEET